MLRALEGRRWRRAVDKLPERVRIADAPPGEETQERRPQEILRKGQHPEVGQKKTQTTGAWAWSRGA